MKRLEAEMAWSVVARHESVVDAVTKQTEKTVHHLKQRQREMERIRQQVTQVEQQMREKINQLEEVCGQKTRRLDEIDATKQTLLQLKERFRCVEVRRYSLSFHTFVI